MKNHVIALDFVRSEKNLADYLTKSLFRTVVLKIVERDGVKSIKKNTAVLTQSRRGLMG